MDKVLVRQQHWRSALLNWAQEVRGQPYVWGKTDCAALMRTALHLQFGIDLFAALPQWHSARSAVRIWSELFRDTRGGYAAILERMGATEIRGRKRGRWPMGTILIGHEDTGLLPAFGIYVDPIVVQSDEEHGVQWSDPTTVEQLESAWLFDCVVMSYG